MGWTKVAVCAICDTDLLCEKCGREQPDDLGEAVSEFIAAMQVCEAIQTRDGSNVSAHIRLGFKDFADANRAHRAIMKLAGSSQGEG